jgi:hypothetical protein
LVWTVSFEMDVTRNVVQLASEDGLASTVDNAMTIG